MAQQLWESNNVKDWLEAECAYSDRIARLQRGNLVELDQWFHTDLPAAIKERKEPHLTKEELCEALEFKMSRGKFRPLRKLVASNDAGVVKATSKEAFVLADLVSSSLAESKTSSVFDDASDCLGDFKAAMNKLKELRGVGVATASLLLATYAPQLAAFMADEALECVVGRPFRYSFSEYYRFLEALTDKCVELNADLDQEHPHFTPQRLSDCLFSAAAVRKEPTGTKRKTAKSASSSPSTGTKRKRAKK
jgi:hypothetical protein